MLKIIFFSGVAVIALQSHSIAQTIQGTVWRSYFAAPIQDTATLAITKDSITISNSHGMIMVKSAFHIHGDTITINDVAGPIKCSADDNGVYSYTLSSGKLILHLLNDPCDGRANSISDREWMRERN